MIKQKIALITILVLLVSNIFFGYKYFALQRELETTKTTVETQQINENVLGFIKLFIEEVLKAEAEVDFDTRLKLETAVRNLNDEEILSQWQKFTESKTEDDAQVEVKNLLEILVNKIKIQ
jgi:cell division protein FtsL